MEGDAGPAAAARRPPGRATSEWTHLYAADVISMPDKWEYPWYAAWDLAFHCVPLALVDSEFAKAQLVLMLREWYMHPNGQMSAYEWAFGDVNPPVHAWAAWRVYKIEKRRRGVGDRGVPRARLPEADAQLHVVGESQGRRRTQRLPGRIPRARQHRRVRPQRRAADRRTAGAVGRHQLDGDVQPQHDGDRSGAGRRQPRLRGHGEQVLGALPEHRQGDESSRRPGRRVALERGGRLLLRRAPHARRAAGSPEGAIDGGPDPAVRGRDPGAGAARTSPGVQAAARLVHRASARSERGRGEHGHARTGRNGGC